LSSICMGDHFEFDMHCRQDGCFNRGCAVSCVHACAHTCDVPLKFLIFNKYAFYPAIFHLKFATVFSTAAAE